MIRIGTRESRLAAAQARIIANLLHEAHPEIESQIVTMRTSGDMLKDKPLDTAGGKGLFTRELDAALLEGRIDIAVHSLKDMPAVLPAGLVIAAFCAAEDPRDALVLPEGAGALDVSKPVGCSSKRRSMQLSALYPGVRCVLARGNVPTRLDKLDAGEYGALVLAVAGLKRLGLEKRASRIFGTAEMLPAAGQGILAAVTRETGEAARLMGEIDEPEPRRRALAERAFIRVLGGGCGIPVAAFARESGGELALEGLYYPEGETAAVSGTLSGSPAKPEELGSRLAFRLLAESARRNNLLGSVALVGAGPGDAGLLTVRAEAALAGAGVVVFDKLVGPGALAKIPPEAEKIYAGKESGRHDVPQEEINAVLVKKAAAGLRVVRLKGGDPLLFGRGSEEALCLADAGIPWEIVPGVPSAVAVAGCAGIPVTHRGIASRLHIVAAHGEGARDIDFSCLARQCTSGDTLVFMMGVARLEHICRSLIDAGLPGSTPAAVVSRGTTAKEQRVAAAVQNLPARALEAGIEPPALTIVGSVCRLAESLAAREKKPLAGVRVAVTRPRGGVNRLAKMLDERGAEVIDLPAIKIVPLDETPSLRETLAAVASGGIGKAWFAFTSVHGVEAFFGKLSECRADIRALAACKFAAVGDATCAALAGRGIFADLVPETFSGAALGEALAKAAAKDETVILPRSAIGGREILDALAAAGLRYVDIPVYSTVPETGYENPAFRARLLDGLDYAAFTSPSAVKAFAGIFGGVAGVSPAEGGAPKKRHPCRFFSPSLAPQNSLQCSPPASMPETSPLQIPALCIGEATAAPARALGMEVIVPETPSLEGMAEALAARCRERS